MQAEVLRFKIKQAVLRDYEQRGSQRWLRKTAASPKWLPLSIWKVLSVLPSPHSPSRLSRDPAGRSSHFSAVLVVAISSCFGTGDSLVTPLSIAFPQDPLSVVAQYPAGLACHRLLVFIRT